MNMGMYGFPAYGNAALTLGNSVANAYLAQLMEV